MANERERANENEASENEAGERAPGTGRERDISNTSYGATEREQTKDLRRRDPRGDANVADGGVSEVLERNSDSPAD